MSNLKFSDSGSLVIDISAWQGNFSIANAVKNHGVKAVIIKIGGGDGKAPFYKDSRFEDYYSQAKKIGIPVGCYFFGAATTTARAKQEADYWLGLMKGKQFELPVFYDVETKAQSDLNKKALTNIINTVLDKVEAAGYFVGLYSSTSWYNSEFDKTIPQKYASWVADWRGKKPKIPAGCVHIWQTGLVRVNGIDVDGDLNYVENYPEVIKSLGLNGFGVTKVEINDVDEVQEAKDPKKSNEEIANEVWLGKWGNGETRKKLITEAGYDYNAVQNIVNSMNGPKKTNEDIAREVINGKWGNGAERKKKINAAGYDYAEIQKIVNSYMAASRR